MRWAVLGMILLVLLAAAGVLVAQQSSQPPAGGGVGGVQGPPGLQIDSGSLVGSPVRGEDGKDVGKVANLMIDAKDGKVAAVVLTMGRTFDIGGTGITFGGKDITVPWDAVKIGRDRDKVIITLHDAAIAPKTQSSTGGGRSPAEIPAPTR
jgi:sporulation protein YlmC with PRC-barrel domain